MSGRLCTDTPQLCYQCVLVLSSAADAVQAPVAWATSQMRHGSKEHNNASRAACQLKATGRSCLTAVDLSFQPSLLMHHADISLKSFSCVDAIVQLGGIHQSRSCCAAGSAGSCVPKSSTRERAWGLALACSSLISMSSENRTGSSYIHTSRPAGVLHSGE